MDSGLRGKTALVTGGGSGIGRAIALALAAEGVHVAIASRNPDPKTAAEIEARGVRALRLEADVSDESQVVSMVRQAIDSFGHLDLYVNNAACAWHQPITRITTEAWLNTINTNLSSCVWACRDVCKHMIERSQGSILIVGSTAQYDLAYTEAAYHISKTGLRVFMETLAIEMAPFGIRVNMLVPGFFPTRLTEGLTRERERTERLMRQIPLRRPGKTEECGPSAVLLLSDKLSPYTTGAQLLVSGGLHLRPLDMYSDDEIVEMNAGD
jgi:NAD(P)-dependent dehydrogenase (short-subunit alcohol dehydrogenase family)